MSTKLNTGPVDKKRCLPTPQPVPVVSRPKSLCRPFATTSRCTFGPRCTFRHERTCPTYWRYGRCHLTDITQCPFVHEVPAYHCSQRPDCCLWARHTMCKSCFQQRTLTTCTVCQERTTTFPTGVCGDCFRASLVRRLSVNTDGEREFHWVSMLPGQEMTARFTRYVTPLKPRQTPKRKTCLLCQDTISHPKHLYCQGCYQEHVQAPARTYECRVCKSASTYYDLCHDCYQHKDEILQLQELLK